MRIETIIRLKDSTIPLGCALALSTTAFRILPPPASITTVFYDPTAAWLWSALTFLSYVLVLIGIWLRNIKSNNSDDKYGKDRGVNYLYFEYSGLIMASIFTAVYAIAVMAMFGLGSVIAIGFTLAIGLYFFFRWLIINRSLKVAKKNTTQNRR